jgi:hypothetical protein
VHGQRGPGAAKHPIPVRLGRSRPGQGSHDVVKFVLIFALDVPPRHQPNLNANLIRDQQVPGCLANERSPPRWLPRHAPEADPRASLREPDGLAERAPRLIVHPPLPSSLRLFVFRPCLLARRRAWNRVRRVVRREMWLPHRRCRQLRLAQTHRAVAVLARQDGQVAGQLVREAVRLRRGVEEGERPVHCVCRALTCTRAKCWMRTPSLPCLHPSRVRLLCVACLHTPEHRRSLFKRRAIQTAQCARRDRLMQDRRGRRPKQQAVKRGERRREARRARYW